MENEIEGFLPADEDPSGYPPRCSQDLRFKRKDTEKHSPYVLFSYIWSRHKEMTPNQILKLSRILRAENTEVLEKIEALMSWEEINNPKLGVMSEAFMEELAGLAEKD